MKVARFGVGAWFWASLGAAFAAGAALRLYRLGAQVLLGDELHAVRAVLSTPLPEILVGYRLTDYCLPLAGLARLALIRTGTLSELDFRWPVVAAGLLLLAAAPVVARRASSPGAAIVYPWLVALSPGLALYSRIARSYAPATLLACAAAAAFFAWWRTGRRRWGAAYAVLGALAIWTSLVVVPFVVSALAFGGLARVLGPRWGAERPGRRNGEIRDAGAGAPGWLGLALAGLALAAGVACFAVPGWDALRQVLAAKPGGGDLRLAAALSAGRLLAGSASPALAAAFWLLAALGLWRLARHDPGLALFGAVLASGQAAALVVLPPYGLGNPVILARYLLVALPVVLLWIAHALAPPERWLRAVRRPRLARTAAGAAAALFLVLLVATGPFVRPRFRHSSFVHHDDFLAFARPLPRLPVEQVPAFYRRLPPGSDDREDAIVELPTFPVRSDRAVHRYQDLHRRPVVVSTPTPELNDRRLAFRQRVPPQPRPILESGARYLVIHRDVGAEELAVGLPPGVPRLWTARQEQLSERFRTVAAATIERLTAAWGPPDLEDDRVVAWDLERVRAGELGQGSRPSSEETGL